METLRDLFLNPSLEQSFLNILSFSNYLKLQWKKCCSNLCYWHGCWGSFYTWGFRCCTSKPWSSSSPYCMPRKGSLTLDHNGLIGLVQKVNKHYTCLLGTEALKGNCQAGLRCLFFFQCECIAKGSKTSISKEEKKPKPIINP